MPFLTKRSYEKELLDRDDIPFDEIVQNMKELDVINQRPLVLFINFLQ